LRAGSVDVAAKAERQQHHRKRRAKTAHGPTSPTFLVFAIVVESEDLRKAAIPLD